MGIKALLVIGVLLASATAGAQALRGGKEALDPSPQTRLTEADRKVTAGRILLKWRGYSERVHGQSYKAWSASLWPLLARADLGDLQKALSAVTYEGMRSALLGQRRDGGPVMQRMARSGVSAGGLVSKALGSLAQDLVFTPVRPCRIADTRVLGWPLHANNSPVPLYVSKPAGNFSAYGGSNTNCNIPAHPAAVALSVTALNNTTTGFLRVYPYDRPSSDGSPVPLNSIGAVVTNDMIVPSLQLHDTEPDYPGLAVYSTATTHYAIFITGYFMAPKATKLDCYTETAMGPIPKFFVGSLGVQCQQEGYIAISGGCGNLGQSQISAIAHGPGIDETRWGCSFSNESSQDQNVSATARCCRIPGR